MDVFQRINIMYQTNFAKIEREILAHYLKGQNMIKLSTGIEVSEETVISALKKVGINVEPKHVFAKGDIAQVFGNKSPGGWRLIISHGSGLRSVNQCGFIQGDGTQEYFEYNGYKFVGRQKDLLEG